jgi:exopolysaccharide biosynthesis polyprenyl glycosylphosphotransferase
LVADGPPAPLRGLICTALFLLTLALMALSGTYRLRAARAPLDHLAHLLGAITVAHGFVLGQLWLAAPGRAPDFRWAATGFGLALLFTLGGRIGLAAYWRRTPAARPRGRAVLIAAGPCGAPLARRLDEATDHAIGYALNWGGGPVSQWRGIDGLVTLEAMIASGEVNEIVLLHQRGADEAGRARITGLLARLADKPVRVRLAVDVSAEIDAFGFAAGQMVRIVPLLDLPLTPAARAYKRGLDIVLGGLMLAFAAPLMAAIALMLAPSGPVLFRQRRTGADGSRFTVLKFRTMRHAPDQGPVVQAGRADPRVTRLGGWLRRTSLDELPQLFNVLRGEMSLVGPRPHAPGTRVGAMPFESMIDLYGVRHRLKPGMTGLAQIRGQRGGTEHREALAARVASDLEYIESWSPLLDLAILLRTIPQVIGGQNAY